LKLLVYSDIHTSPKDDEIYGLEKSQNIHNIFKSMLWARQLAKDLKCDKIINNGDFLDSDKIEAEVSYLVSKIYENNTQEELILLGNHEIKDVKGKYNSLNILKPYPNIKIIDKISMSKAGDTTLIFQPYSKDPEAIKKLVYTLDKIKGKKILFSHLTYVNVPNVMLNPNIKGEIDYRSVRDKVDLIFNGHIHIGLESDKYVQCGTLDGISFNDDYKSPYHKPGVIILDTDTLKWERIENPYAILYKKVKWDKIDIIDKSELNRTRLSVECPAEKIEEVRKQLENLNALSYRITLQASTIKDENGNEIEKTDFNLYTDPSQALYDFIKIEKGIYTEELLSGFIKEYVEGEKVVSGE